MISVSKLLFDRFVIFQETGIKITHPGTYSSRSSIYLDTRDKEYYKIQTTHRQGRFTSSLYITDASGGLERFVKSEEFATHEELLLEILKVKDMENK